MPRINVFRSWTCSQSIRQRICRRAATLYFNLHWNSQILEYRSQGWSNLTSFQLGVELRFSNAQGCQPLMRGSKFHSVGTNLSHQSRRTLPRDWVANKVAVHENCDLVSMFLSSKSQRRIGFPNQIPRCTFPWDKYEFTKLAHSLGQVSRGFCKIHSVLSQV